LQTLHNKNQQLINTKPYQNLSNTKRNVLNEIYKQALIPFTKEIQTYISQYVSENMIETSAKDNKKYLVITPFKLYILIKLHECFIPDYTMNTQNKTYSSYTHIPLLETVINILLANTSPDSQIFIKQTKTYEFIKLLNLKYTENDILFNYDEKPKNTINLNIFITDNDNKIKIIDGLIKVINDENCRNRKEYLINVNPFYKYIKDMIAKYCNTSVKSYKSENYRQGLSIDQLHTKVNNTVQESREMQQSKYYETMYTNIPMKQTTSILNPQTQSPPNNNSQNEKLKFENALGVKSTKKSRSSRNSRNTKLGKPVKKTKTLFARLFGEKKIKKPNNMQQPSNTM